ncbi:serine hydrolase domain-containing protein [Humibacter albus]|uniref:serine hydrolase domain-containing protein n=1 Tax=Humibacter albus TaxID=427754 RepID=UPI000405A10B|nr:serine hydrolase [Humibacter albus]
MSTEETPLGSMGDGEPVGAEAAGRARATRRWRRSTPEGEGVDAAGIHSLIGALEADPAQDPHALIVVRHGAVVASVQWEPYATQRPQLVYSLSKSFTSTAAAFAAAEGLLDLDTPAADYFPEYADSVADKSRGILVRHLASMATGHVNDMIVSFQADPQHPIKAFLASPPEREPGSLFTYNQLATYTLASIIQRGSGQRLSEYLRPRLFEPLGIAPVGWQQEPVDVELGFSGLFATPEAVAKLGQLYLDGGVWNGRRLLAEEWVREATREHIATVRPDDLVPPNPDWAQGYGFQFWMSRHGFRGDGAFGQFCLVLPEHDAVVAITSQTDDLQGTLDHVWTHLLPAFGPARAAAGTTAESASAAAADGADAGGGADASGSADAAGADVSGEANAAGADAASGTGPMGAELAVERRVLTFPTDLGPLSALADSAAGAYPRADDARSQTEYRLLESVTLSRDGDGWTLTLAEVNAERSAESADAWVAAVGGTPPTGTVTGHVGDGAWAVTEGEDSGTLGVPTGVRAGIRDDGVLHVEVAFIDTPHRLTLLFDTAARTVTPRWITQALGFEGAFQLRAVRPGERFQVVR